MHIGDHAIRAPDSVALIVADGPTVSYRELYDRSRGVAAVLYEVAYLVDDSEAKALFTATADEVRIRLGAETSKWRSYGEVLAGAREPPPISDGSEMLYSSGTTGRPKAVRRPLPQDGNGSWAQKVLEHTLTRRYGMSASSVYLSPAPLYHAAGSTTRWPLSGWARQRS